MLRLKRGGILCVRAPAHAHARTRRRDSNIQVQVEVYVAVTVRVGVSAPDGRKNPVPRRITSKHGVDASPAAPLPLHAFRETSRVPRPHRVSIDLPCAVRQRTACPALQANAPQEGIVDV